VVSKKMAVVVLSAATATTVVVAATRNRKRLSGHEVTLRSVTVNRPASVIYEFWRDLPRLASALDRRAEVEVVDDEESRWTVAGPMGSTLHWSARITHDEPDRTLSWRVEKGLLPHEGRLELVEAPGEHAQRYIPILLERVAAGEIDASYLATHPLPLEQGAPGYELFERKEDGCLRAVLQPQS